jgi:hypothetical protein
VIGCIGFTWRVQLQLFMFFYVYLPSIPHALSSALSCLCPALPCHLSYPVRPVVRPVVLLFSRITLLFRPLPFISVTKQSRSAAHCFAMLHAFAVSLPLIHCAVSLPLYPIPTSRTSLPLALPGQVSVGWLVSACRGNPRRYLVGGWEVGRSTFTHTHASLRSGQLFPLVQLVQCIMLFSGLHFTLSLLPHTPGRT